MLRSFRVSAKAVDSASCANLLWYLREVAMSRSGLEAGGAAYEEAEFWRLRYRVPDPHCGGESCKAPTPPTEVAASQGPLRVPIR
ncbi:hypothetical protein DID88_002618 [Monilinia fructigena]|uniref:Uncharacterized protein n=1 Tax=Monilinia fructigena TaxID=38457 RepID=A0A395IPC4_9HELO|nr:hypothetical protein DID88_002618 [Monilinia fructigena]